MHNWQRGSLREQGAPLVWKGDEFSVVSCLLMWVFGSVTLIHAWTPATPWNVGQAFGAGREREIWSKAAVLAVTLA